MSLRLAGQWNAKDPLTPLNPTARVIIADLFVDDDLPVTGTSRITIRLNDFLPGIEAKTFCRAGSDLP